MIDAQASNTDNIHQVLVRGIGFTIACSKLNCIEILDMGLP